MARPLTLSITDMDAEFSLQFHLDLDAPKDRKLVELLENAAYKEGYSVHKVPPEVDDE